VHAAAEEDDPVLDEITAEGAGGVAWTLSLHRDRMRVTDGTQTFTYTRDEIASASTIFLSPRGAAVDLPGWKRGLRFEAFDLATLRQWMSPALGAWARAETRREGLVSSLIGIAVLTLWMFHDAWFLFAFGELTLATCFGRRFAPGRWIYLASAGRTLVTMGVTLAEIAAERIVVWWLFIAVALVGYVVDDLRRYRFFAPFPAE
jgi:hypothetical protein